MYLNDIVTLLLTQRFDLMAKYIYVKYKIYELQTEFHKDLYREHIRTFNNFKEVDNNKNNEKDFFDAFDKLINDMKKNGYDKKYPIPLGSNKVLKNGAHRLMTSYFLKLEPEISILNENVPDFYNYEFFLQREKFPLSRDYSDFMALECIKLNPNLRSMIIYPNCSTPRNLNIIKKIIQNFGVIYYEKSVQLSDNGLNNLINEQYRGEEWIGGMFPKFGQGGKYQRCRGKGKIHILLIHLYDISLDNLKKLKEECRKKFKLGKHSLHITDFQEDTFRVSSSLLNNNSVFYLNQGTYNFSNNTKKLLECYFKEVNGNENFCITSGIILELFGLRNSKDLDYLHKEDLDLNLSNISPHKDEWLKYYSMNKENIIFNPKNYFYFNGHKFITLEILREMKKKRNEEKDVRDIKLIQNIYNL